MVLSHQCSLFPFLPPELTSAVIPCGGSYLAAGSSLGRVWDAAFANQSSLLGPCRSLTPGQCQAVPDAPLCPPAVPQDLMDAPGAVLPPMWQPSTRKSSCSSCSQSGSSDGGPANGCSHERYEDNGHGRARAQCPGTMAGSVGCG